MKNIKEFAYCEYCDSPIELSDPFSPQSYDQGVIRIYSGKVLLREDGIKREERERDLRGFYCNLQCLIEFIGHHRGGEAIEVLSPIQAQATDTDAKKLMNKTSFHELVLSYLWSGYSLVPPEGTEISLTIGNVRYVTKISKKQ